mmetsp:Transcript_11838/g.17753  ORF Transcript_11838/g.17753 Transcript_11838/m.17753 type:complete len:265 (-) Transcript_11838:188-982(-)
MWSAALDPLGSDAWIYALIAMRDSPPRATSSDPHYLLRDTNSPDGDPSRASAWKDAPCPAGRRAARSLRSLGTLSPWALPPEVLATYTGHSPRHDLPNVSRAGGDPLADTNEIGRWSGSLAQLDPEPGQHQPSLAATSAGTPSTRRYSMPALYSSAAAASVVPQIMERQLSRLRAVVAAHGPGNLPFVGGWSLVREVSRTTLHHEHTAARATVGTEQTPLLLTMRTDGEANVACQPQQGNASGTMGELSDAPHHGRGDTAAQTL